MLRYILLSGRNFGKGLGAFTKLRKANISFAVSVRPHGTTRLTLDGFSYNFTPEYFSKIL